MNQITLTADIVEFADNYCRNMYEKIDNKILCLNRRIDNLQSDNRTMKQKIKELEKQIKRSKK
jgi:peptidoglycan hydrolase CwlO-like protein